MNSKSGDYILMRLESKYSLLYMIIMPPPKPTSKHVANTPAAKDGAKAPAKDGDKAPVTNGGGKGGKKGGNPKDGAKSTA
jgi:hypothetical protein